MSEVKANVDQAIGVEVKPDADLDIRPKSKRKWKKRTKSGPRKRSKNSRYSCLRTFLLRTFGEDLMKTGSGVLDIAGGKGQLSYELLNLNDVPTTLMDPCEPDSRHFKDRIFRGQWHHKPELTLPSVSIDEVRARGLIHPKNFRMLFQYHLWEECGVHNQENEDAKTTDEFYEKFKGFQTKIMNKWNR